jgi:hypothetical protein
MFSVCTLLYGDHTDLAKRLLDSLSKPSKVLDFRIGLNAVSPATYQVVRDWIATNSRRIKTPVYLYEGSNSENLGKYPLMRQMLYDNLRPIGPRVMWFDDDSYLDATSGDSWWHSTLDASNDKTQLGAVHYIMQRGRQHEVIKQQDWYTGKPVNARHRFTFVTGGWWVAQSCFLKKWDYPFWGLYHNGGDSIFGELVRQQAGSLYHFSTGCLCHCESCNKTGIIQNKPVVHINVGGRKGRRGIGVTGENYIWSDGNAQPDLSHQKFELRISRYEI